MWCSFIYLFLTPQPLVRRPGTQSGGTVSWRSVSKPEAETPGTDFDTMWSGEGLSHKSNKMYLRWCSVSKIDTKEKMKDYIHIKMNGSVSEQFGGKNSTTYFLWMTCFNFPFSTIVTLWQMKRWSELSCALKLYFCFSVVSLLVLVGITSVSISKQHKSTDIIHEDNFTVSLIQLFGLREYQCVSRCSGCLEPSHSCLKLLVVYKSRCFCDVVV